MVDAQRAEEPRGGGGRGRGSKPGVTLELGDRRASGASAGAEAGAAGASEGVPETSAGHGPVSCGTAVFGLTGSDKAFASLLSSSTTGAIPIPAEADVNSTSVFTLRGDDGLASAGKRNVDVALVEVSTAASSDEKGSLESAKVTEMTKSETGPRGGLAPGPTPEGGLVARGVKAEAFDLEVTPSAASAGAKAAKAAKAAKGDGAKKVSFAAAYALRKSRWSMISTGASLLRPTAGPEGGDMGFPSAVFNLTNSIVGAGLVALPFVLLSSGYVPFLIYIAVAFAGNKLTLDMLVAGSNESGLRSYEALGQAAIGRTGIALSAAAMLAHGFIALVAFLILVADSAPAVFANLGTAYDVEWIRQIRGDQVQIFVSVFILLPLCMLKNQNKLAYTSLFALAVFALVMLTIIYNAFTDDWYRLDTSFAMDKAGNKVIPCDHEGIKPFGHSKAMVKHIPTLLFAFVCHNSVLSVYGELKDQSPGTMRNVNTSSLVIAATLYTVCAFFGAMTYGNNTCGVVLKNIRHCVCTEWSGTRCHSECLKSEACADTSTWGSVLNLLFAFAIILGYANIQFPLRQTQVNMIWGVDKEFSYPIHIGLGVANIASSLFVAMVVGDKANTVFNWGGALSAPAIAFVLPGLFFLALLSKTGSETMKAYPGRPLAICGIILGISVMVLGLSLEVEKILAPKK